MQAITEPVRFGCHLLFWIGLAQPFGGIFEVSGARKLDGCSQCAGDIEHFLLERPVLVELLVGCGIGFHVADITVALGRGKAMFPVVDW
jgi:hypothetical protein